MVPSQVSYTSIPKGISAGEQRVFPRTDATAPPAASSSRILTHHQSASNVVHANTTCHIAFLLSLLGLDQRLFAFGCCQSRDPMADPLGPSSGTCAFAKPGDQWLADPIMGDNYGSGDQQIWPPKPWTQASSGTRGRRFRPLCTLAFAVVYAESSSQYSAHSHVRST